ncbi:hypothetical protein LSAT2_023759 [Lamellibrachia satsuma]|nr:hypothetical protein LSAT2_023759 [Lamellibrachia satsuma]
MCEQDALVEIFVRRCEPRYCCQTGCTCLGDIHESENMCKNSTVVHLSCFVEHKDTRFLKYICCNGYEEDASGICVEKLDCAVNNGGCEQMCVSASDTIPADHCACETGYTLHNRTRCYPTPGQIVLKRSQDK